MVGLCPVDGRGAARVTVEVLLSAPDPRLLQILLDLDLILDDDDDHGHDSVRFDVLGGNGRKYGRFRGEAGELANVVLSPIFSAILLVQAVCYMGGTGSTRVPRSGADVYHEAQQLTLLHSGIAKSKVFALSFILYTNTFLLSLKRFQTVAIPA